MRVAGGVGIVQDLYVGDDFYIGKVSNTDTIEFQVLGESGATTIGRVGQGGTTDGSLTVHGDVTFNRDVTFNGDALTFGVDATDVLTVNAISTFTDNVTVNGDLDVDGNTVIEGNLTVNGTTTTINSTTQTLDDPVFTLGGDTAPSQADAKDRGIEFRYYSGSAQIGFFGWDNSLVAMLSIMERLILQRHSLAHALVLTLDHSNYLIQPIPHQHLQVH